LLCQLSYGGARDEMMAEIGFGVLGPPLGESDPL
jgi:hypothetical protein